MIDLHSHTTASDGEHAPAELVRRAAEAGLRVLAVTDHDTVAGLAAAAEAAAARSLTLVPGIELSAFLGQREVHVLGHFLDPALPELARFQARLGAERETRMAAMVDKMRGLGFPVSLGEVKALAKGAQLGRPHLALLLVEKRICTSTKEAFDRFLGNGKPAWVDRFRLSAEDAIALIRRAGGSATIAHPAVSRVDAADLERLAGLGLAGVEVYHPDHPDSVREKLLQVARTLSLVPTAGSDFHGEKVAPGRRLGSASMPEEAFLALKARAAARA